MRLKTAIGLLVFAASHLAGQTTLISENFTGGLPSGYTVQSGSAVITNGALRMSSACVQLPGTFSRAQGLTIEADVTIYSGTTGDFNIWALADSAPGCHNGPNNGYYLGWYPTGSDNTQDRLWMQSNAVPTQLAATGTSIPAGQSRHIKAEFLTNGTINMYVGGTKILTATNQTHNNQRLILRSWQGVDVDNLVVKTLSVAPPTTYSLSGSAGITGATVRITGPSNYSNQKVAGTGGAYTFTGLSNGTYTVTPTRSGYTFTPPSRSVTIAGANQNNVNFTGTPITQSSIEIIGYEVTQAVQNLKNGVVLVEGKPTFVRVHARSTGADIISPGGHLNLRRLSGGGTGVYSVPRAYNYKSVRVTQSPTRANLDSGFLFELPVDWLHGEIELEFGSTTNSVTSAAPGSESCVWQVRAPILSDIRQCMTTGGADSTKLRVSFSPSPRMVVRIGSVGWKDEQDVVHEASAADISGVAEEIKTLYPVASILLARPFTLSAVGPQPTNLVDLAVQARRVEELRIMDGCLDVLGCKDIYLGVLASPPGFTTSGGYASLFGKGAVAYTGGRSSAHELGHLLGLTHVKCSGGEGLLVNVFYPYPDGKISLEQDMAYASPETFWGYSPLRPVRPTTGDVMSYCDAPWPSDYTYDRLRQELIAAFGTLSGAPLSTISSLTIAGRAATVTQDALVVSGSIQRDLASASIDSVQGVQIPVVSMEGAGSARLVLRNAADAEIGSSSFEPLVDPYDTETLRFTEIVPKISGMARLEVVVNGKVLGQRRASSSAPMVQVATPVGGEDVSTDGITVRWTASDGDNDSLTFAVQFSADGGDTWRTLALNLTDTEFEADLQQLQATERGVFRVLASDGLLTSQAQSSSFVQVAAMTPSVTVEAPLTGSVVSTLDPLTLQAIAIDWQEGVLPDAQVTWVSDLSGPLGVGASLSLQASRLAPGPHRISVTGINSGGIASTAWADIRVEAGVIIPPVPQFTVHNGASFVTTALSPGTIMTLFGTNLTTGVSGAVSGTTTTLPTKILGTMVVIDGLPVPLYAVANVNGLEQINFQAPFELTPGTSVDLSVERNGVRSDPARVAVVDATPGVFTSDGQTGIIVHGTTNKLITSSDRAVPGEVIVLYATGLGKVTPQPASGTPTPLSPLHTVPETVALSVGGVDARVLFAGLTPGYVGLYQINAEIPDIESGMQDVVVTVAGRTNHPVKMSVAGTTSAVASVGKVPGDQ